MTMWSTSFPGVLRPVCGETDGALQVHHETGRTLRIGGEIRLCFECGPDGGVYHPDDVDMETAAKRAAELDQRFNQFEMHSHYTLPGGKNGPTIEHSHTDGSDPHRHTEAATARFESTKDQHRADFLGGGVGRVKMTKQPTGPQLDYSELTEAERTFRVVCFYRYDPGVGPWDGKGNVPLYTRAQWRRSMELYIAAARYPGLDPVGGGAIPMTTARMMLAFRLTPIYEIEGWTPTPRAALP